MADEELSRAAGHIWSEGNANAIDWEIRGPLGVFTTADRATWRTEAGDWTAELRRSRSGNHWFLVLFQAGVYRGRYDASGWHTATDRKRARQLRSYQLPLAAWSAELWLQKRMRKRRPKAASFTWMCSPPTRPGAVRAHPEQCVQALSRAVAQILDCFGIGDVAESPKVPTFGTYVYAVAG